MNQTLETKKTKHDLHEGTVVSFNNNTGKASGYGFIRQDHGADIFVHINDVVGAHEGNRPELFAGDRVSFEIAQGRKGPVAKNVRVTLRADNGDVHRPPLHRHD